LVIEKRSETYQKIKGKLLNIYGEDKGESVFARLYERMEEFKANNPAVSEKIYNKDRLTEEDVVLITYGDQVKDGDDTLDVLHRFLNKYVKGYINIVHILPFFPYSSDDGFAVIDYKKVNDKMGDWTDITELSEEYDLMFDAVINHISSHSEWFQKYKEGDPEYLDYFIEVDPNVDVSKVTRPRAKPLLTEVKTNRGKKHVWTTFSPDQIDLNYKNEDLLLNVIDILLFYVKKGASIIRLDAIAYLWKEIGTSSIHLEETHELIKLFRCILDEVAPEVLIITETNVPYEENISYFGEEEKEADMVYQFTLPPLVLHTFYTGSSKKLINWARDLKEFGLGKYYFNFLASHDGIGVRPVEGILTAEEIDSLANRAKENGGFVSYKTNNDGSKSPYELNITYFDALVQEKEPLELKIRKFINAHSILLTFRGIPAIYIHSLLGSRNYVEGVKMTGEKRTINREKLSLEKLETSLNEKGTIRHRVYNSFKDILSKRKKESALHPNADQIVLDIDDRIFAVLRENKQTNEQLLALHNISNEEINDINLEKVMKNNQAFKDVLENNNLGKIIDLKPYDFKWIK